jgi:hypothetical protein
MSALENMIAGTKCWFAVHEYTRQPEIARAAEEYAALMRLVEAVKYWKMMRDSEMLVEALEEYEATL